ncbi:uncharacterized protein LOC124673906 [Lolium rigidum]|uniref:uncharacterized protein LOC124673906 n=1 Tax=Lolium rigidum TaxID=89674 RepID=UPI001F5C1553|nr:uncharacterized protein LOC124673906 [Lolium rigidum]XP_047065911.1 uncharacterized protein LOC124673906 [Lolium rigidum]
MVAFTLIIQLFSDWEIHALILSSFALQLFLFFSGGLRRRHNHMLLRIMIWLSYLSADFVAVFALGYLSRNLPITSTADDNHHKPTHQLMLLWAPFLLIHLGGQDTVTAFSLEDNELWLRHLLNLLCQACLVVYVLWKLVALAHYQLVIMAVFLFVAGIIKYGERIWALKLGSKKGLRTNTSAEVTRMSREIEESPTHWTYQEVVWYGALHTEEGVRDIFAGRKILDMRRPVRFNFLQIGVYDVEEAQGGHTQVDFKKVEIELSIMYDNLFTKSRVIRTRPGIILRCVSIASTVVAFVLYAKMMMNSSADAKKKTAVYNNGYRRSTVDAAITYILFFGAFCLEVWSFFIVMMSPWAWPLLRTRPGWCSRVLFTRMVWPIFVRIQPDTKPWWSNSMGQYNFLSTSSSMAAHNDFMHIRRRSIVISRISAKMACIFVIKELWKKIHITKHAKMTREIKELIHKLLWGHPEQMCVPKSYRSVLCLPFEELLLSLHVWTDVVVHKADKSMNSSNLTSADKEGRQRHMDTCKKLSDYMLYLMVEHPAMLPVSTNVQDVLVKAAASDWANGASDKEYYLEHLTTTYNGPGQRFWRNQIPLLGQPRGIDAELETLEQLWVRFLVYAGGKSHPEEHARRLSTGGELITFVWLLMAHHGMGNVNDSISLTKEDVSTGHLLYW